MSTQIMNNSSKAKYKESVRFKNNDINLNAQILRLQTLACMKEISNIWHLDQSRICSFFQNYHKLPLSKIQANELFEVQGTRMIKNENKIYLGQVYNKKKHGTGISVYKDGRIYEGSFYDNQKDGFGCQLYSNGNLYIGNFSQNKKHGKGSFYWFSLCTPACTKQASLKIQQYHGDWWGGLPDGQGEHQKANGDYYIGGFKNGLKHGEGIQYYANGDIYQGEFLNGLPEGYGQYKWADQSKYKGDFKQGYRNGYGVWQNTKGKQQYKGHYLLDRKHGYGIYDWGNGTVYKGNYLEDVRTGQGQLYRNGQLVYEGLWENGEQAQDFKKQVTPPKKRAFSTSEKIANNNSSVSNFRVKTTKTCWHKPVARRNSAATVKNDNFQINFKLLESRSTHRGCQACSRRQQTGQQHSQKFSRAKFTSSNVNTFENPQQYAN